MAADGSIQPSSDGLPLHEAMLAWCDPAQLAELERVEEVYGSHCTLASIFGKETAADRFANPYARTLDLLRAEIIGKLLSGELVSTGFEEGMPADAAPRLIRPERWHVLTPDFDTSSATGTGLTLSCIRVSLRADDPRTTPGPANTRNVVRFVLLKNQRTAQLDGIMAKLPPRPFQLLLLLVMRLLEGRPLVSTNDILSEIFTGQTASATARGLMNELRTHLERDLRKTELASRIIETRSSIGYSIALDAGEVRIDS